MSPKQKAALVAILVTLAGLVGYTVVVPSSGEPGQVPPVLVPSASASPTPDSTALPPLPETGCAAPVGMTKLEDQVPLSEDSQLPWKRNGNPRVPITISAPKVAPTSDWAGYLNFAAQAWNRSPCLDMRVVFGPCPAAGNCATFAVGGSDDGNFDAREKNGFTVGGSITVNPSLSAAERKNVVVHELGHASGLAHRKTKNVLMNEATYDSVFDPDATDMRNLLFLYGRQK